MIVAGAGVAVIHATLLPCVDPAEESMTRKSDMCVRWKSRYKVFHVQINVPRKKARKYFIYLVYTFKTHTYLTGM